jgi:hypothetical protein
LQGEVTHLSSELTEESEGQRAVMVGLVTGMRLITTKKGEAMGFVQLEDVQGGFECVVFPRLWKQTQALWQNEKIVLVRGTIDAKGRTPKILADSATDKPQVVQDGSRRQETKKPEVRSQEPGSRRQETKKPEVRSQDSAPKAAPPTSNLQRPTSAVDFVDDRYDSAVEEFDPFAGEFMDMDDPFVEDSPAPKAVAPHKPIDRVTESTADYAVRAPQSPPRNETMPAPKSNGNGNGNGYARSMSVSTDARRVGEVHQAMSTRPGPDKFCFIVMARGGTLQLDFPNDSTTLNDELIAQLKSMPGVESVQVSMM